jgi:hypothetical protein
MSASSSWLGWRGLTGGASSYGGSSEKATAAGDSFTSEYDENTKAVKPVDSGMEKVAKDRAGHGWRKWTREELMAHIGRGQLGCLLVIGTSR